MSAVDPLFTIDQEVVMDPSPEQIMEMTQAIQREWSDSERRQRLEGAKRWRKIFNQPSPSRTVEPVSTELTGFDQQWHGEFRTL